MSDEYVPIPDNGLWFREGLHTRHTYSKPERLKYQSLRECDFKYNHYTVYLCKRVLLEIDRGKCWDGQKYVPSPDFSSVTGSHPTLLRPICDYASGRCSAEVVELAVDSIIENARQLRKVKDQIKQTKEEIDAAIPMGLKERLKELKEEEDRLDKVVNHGMCFGLERLGWDDVSSK